jgi:hypothetical protein
MAQPKQVNQISTIDPDLQATCRPSTNLPLAPITPGQEAVFTAPPTVTCTSTTLYTITMQLDARHQIRCGQAPPSCPTSADGVVGKLQRSKNVKSFSNVQCNGNTLSIDVVPVDPSQIFDAFVRVKYEEDGKKPRRIGFEVITFETCPVSRRPRSRFNVVAE